MKPRLLDLCCRAGGGASEGYADAGFECEGVDIVFQPNYPFKFYLADGLLFPPDGYDCYHVSPPCQDYTTATIQWRTPSPQGRLPLLHPFSGLEIDLGQS